MRAARRVRGACAVVCVLCARGGGGGGGGGRRRRRNHGGSQRGLWVRRFLSKPGVTRRGVRMAAQPCPVAMVTICPYLEQVAAGRCRPSDRADARVERHTSSSRPITYVVRLAERRTNQSIAQKICVRLRVSSRKALAPTIFCLCLSCSSILPARTRRSHD